MTEQPQYGLGYWHHCQKCGAGLPPKVSTCQCGRSVHAALAQTTTSPENQATGGTNGNQ